MNRLTTAPPSSFAILAFVLSLVLGVSGVTQAQPTVDTSLGQDPFLPPPGNAVAWRVINGGHRHGPFGIPGRFNILNRPVINPDTSQTGGRFVVPATVGTTTTDARWGKGPECIRNGSEVFHLHTNTPPFDPPPPGFFDGDTDPDRLACGHGELAWVLVNGVCGDLNNDGIVDSSDASFSLQNLTQSGVLTDTLAILGDVNGDGQHDVGDTVLTNQAIRGTRTIADCGPGGPPPGTSPDGVNLKVAAPNGSPTVPGSSGSQVTMQVTATGANNAGAQLALGYNPTVVQVNQVTPAALPTHMCPQVGPDKACDTAVFIDNTTGVVYVAYAGADDAGVQSFPVFTMTLDLVGSPGASTGVVFTNTLAYDAGDPTSGGFPRKITVSTQNGGIFITSPPSGNQPPVLTPIGSLSLNEGQIRTVPIFATDPNGNPLTFSVTNLPPFGVFTSTSVTTATLALSPDFNDAGVYTTTVRVQDPGGLSDSEIVSIIVINVNRAPQLAPTGNQTLNEGESKNVSISATDLDGNSLTFNAAGLPDFCSLTNNNNATATIICTPGFNAAGNFPVTVTVTDNGSPPLSDSETFTITVNNVAQPLTIPQIQGAGHLSPLNGQQVVITGTVTLLTADGFYMQDPNGDGDSSTSDGIFVFIGGTFTVNVGDNVTVAGTVFEFRLGDNLPITEIIDATTTINSSGNPLPAPVVIGEGARIPPNEVINTPDGTTNVLNPAALYLPDIDGIDFYESLEGMLAQVINARVVGPTNNFGELWVVGDNGDNAGSFTARGGVYVTPDDLNPERIQFDYSLFQGGAPNLSVGAVFTSTNGVWDYSFGNYEILVTDQTPPTTTTQVISTTTTLVASDNQPTIATWNLRNLGGSAPQGEFDKRANQIVIKLKSPDIIALQEIQDNNGSTNDGTTDSSVTVNRLISAILGNGGPSYSALWINPLNNQSGGQFGANIRSVWFYNPLRVGFTPRPGGSATTPAAVNCIGGVPQVSPNPALIDPTNSAWIDSRKPLVAQFDFNGNQLYVINIHFISPTTDDPLFGVNQPPILNSQPQRLQQAQVVNGFVNTIRACDPNANVIVAGGVYDPLSSSVTDALIGAGLFNLAGLLPENERYNYVFEGNSQQVDTILFPFLPSPNSLQAVTQAAPTQVEYDIVHTNAEFAQQVSDHDPIVARLTFSDVAQCATDVSNQVRVTRGGFRLNRATGRYVQQVTLTNPSGSGITGPVALALDNLSSNATLFNASGNTDCATPVSPYLVINVGSDNVLSPGEIVTVVLEFSNPSNKGITYTTRVLAGSEER